MSKSSTIQELMGSDLAHGQALMRRYYKASSLPIGEKNINAPKVCQFRRDKVMRRLINLQLTSLAKALLNR